MVMLSVKKIFLLLTLFFCANISFAGVTISGTRIIFNGNEKEVSVRTTNKGKVPALVQVWIDEGKVNADVNTVKTPFLITPPVYRVEPGKGQSLRLIYNGMELPQDRESLFWFNLLEVPPAKNEQNKNQLEIAFRTRIKIFYRPQALKESSMEVFKHLKWDVVSDASKGTGIKVTNPTPYYFSLDTGKFTIGNTQYLMNMDTVAPGKSETFYAFKQKAPAGNVSQMIIRVLNDYGAGVEKKLVRSATEEFTEVTNK
ncbi:pilus assembly protein [Serratia sp. S1B]|nr:pilus assembly protein [Serratia sp. S1B]